MNAHGLLVDPQQPEKKLRRNRHRYREVDIKMDSFNRAMKDLDRQMERLGKDENDDDDE